ncbi:hypothetical protein ABBQ32_010121 [Trebouxia sp. C0010 RCD-2024]
MDEDELAVLQKSTVKTKAEYDTFGDTAAELAQRAAAADAQARPSAIPGAVFQDLIAPVPDSVGIRLLQKMGWRQGKGIGSVDTSASGVGTKGGSRWGRVAGVGVENTPLYALKPKDTLHGLGFDPFKDAEVFRRAKGGQGAPGKPPAAGTKRTRGVAFGSGAADEDDSYGMMEDYVADDGDKRKGLLYEIADGSDDEDLPMVMGRRVARHEPYRLTGAAAPLAIKSQEHGRQPCGFIAGFVRGPDSTPTTVFPPPKVPADYQPVHKFTEPLHADFSAKGSSQPAAPAVAAPTDPTLLRNINTLARYVSKNGPAFEQIARVRNVAEPSFAFLRGGQGAAYYAWKVQQLSASPDQLQSASAVARRSTPLSADDRGAVLGETALPSAALSAAPGPALAQPLEPVQYSGFVPSGSQSARPNLTGIAEGDRSRLKNLLASNFQQPSAEPAADQKAMLQAGLQHRAAATAPGVTAAGGVSAASAQAMVAAMANRFASSGTPQLLGIPQGGLEVATPKIPPTAAVPLTRPAPWRTVEEWRPAALLCKRFNVADPYKGKADRTVHMSRFKTDYLALPDTMAAISHQATTSLDASQQQQQQQQQTLPPPPKRQQQPQQQQQMQTLPSPPKQLQQQQQQVQEQLSGPPPVPWPGGTSHAGAVPDTVHNMTADAFLNSLGMELAAATMGASLPGAQTQAAEQEGPEAALAEQQQAALEKPIDLFKAIFENEDDSSSEDVSDTEQPPDGAQPRPAAAPAITPELPRNQAGQSQQANESRTEVAAAANAGQGPMQTHQAPMGHMQTPHGAALEGFERHVSGSPRAALHQAAAPLQTPVLVQSSEQPSHPSKKRKLKGKEKEKEKEKEKSHKKKSKKEKDKKRSGHHKKKQKHKRHRTSSSDEEGSSSGLEES